MILILKANLIVYVVQTSSVQMFFPLWLNVCILRNTKTFLLVWQQPLRFLCPLSFAQIGDESTILPEKLQEELLQALCCRKDNSSEWTHPPFCYDSVDT